MKFLLKPKKKRSAVSPVIATLLLIAIAVAAAIIVYAFVTGLIGGLSGGASSNLITAIGSLTIPSGSGAGTLIVSVTNNAASPITGIQVAYTGMEDSGTSGAVCMGELPSDISCYTPAGVAETAAMCGETQTGLAATSVPFCTTSGTTLLITATPLAVSAETSAVDAVTTSVAGTPLTTGTSYTLSVTVDFANGSTHTQSITVTGII